MFESNFLRVTYVALWGLVIVLYFAVFLLYRHLGRQLLRSKGMENQGPDVGETLASELPLLGNATYALANNQRAHVIFLGSLQCRPCIAVRSVIGNLARTNADRVGVIVIHSGDEDSTRSFVDEMPRTVRAVADPSRKFFEDWRVRSTPFAIVTDANGIVRAKGIANTELLNSFFDLAVSV